MALLNLTQAASMAGISRVTLNKHLRYGKKNGNERVMITTVNAPDGSTRIDSSEILRVYGDAVNGNSVGACKPLQPLQEALQRENDALQAEAQLLREQLAKAEEREQWFRNKVDELTNTIKQIEYKPDPVVLAPVPDPDPPLPPTAEPVPPIAPDPEPTRAWWKRLFSR